MPENRTQGVSTRPPVRIREKLVQWALCSARKQFVLTKDGKINLAVVLAGKPDLRPDRRMETA